MPLELGAALELWSCPSQWKCTDDFPFRKTCWFVRWIEETLRLLFDVVRRRICFVEWNILTPKKKKKIWQSPGHNVGELLSMFLKWPGEKKKKKKRCILWWGRLTVISDQALARCADPLLRRTLSQLHGLTCSALCTMTCLDFLSLRLWQLIFEVKCMFSHRLHEYCVHFVMSNYRRVRKPPLWYHQINNTIQFRLSCVLLKILFFVHV